MGAFYFGAAAVLGGIFVLDAVRTWRERSGTLAGAQPLSLLAALPRAHVRRDGDRPHRLVNRLLWTLALGVFAGALDLSVLSPALPALGRDVRRADGDLAWVFTIYLLVTVLSIAIASTLADRYGRRPIYLACIALFAVGSVVAITAPTLRRLLLVARAIQALGAGGIFPVATATIGDVVPPSRRGAALGMVAATWGLAAVIGPSLGGLITHYVSWRWIFAANVPLAAVVFALALNDLPPSRRAARPRLDVVGLLLLCAGLLALMDGLIGMRLVHRLLGGRDPLLGFVVLGDADAVDPIVPLELLRAPQLIKTYALEIVIGVLEGSLFFIPTVLGRRARAFVRRGRLRRGARRVDVRDRDSRVRGARSTASAAATCCWSVRCSPSSAWRSLRSGFNRSRSRCSR